VLRHQLPGGRWAPGLAEHPAAAHLPRAAPLPARHRAPRAAPLRPAAQGARHLRGEAARLHGHAKVGFARFSLANNAVTF